jgi:RNA polymerase sigma-70 factor, ECF subfamily
VLKKARFCCQAPLGECGLEGLAKDFSAAPPLTSDSDRLRPGTMTDLDLVRRILAGDESACEEFFADYFPRLYRFALSRLAGDEQAVEDVVQLTLIRAVRKLHTYRGEAALFTWLCTLCRREISGRLEHCRRTAEVSLVEDHPATRMALDAAASLASTTDPEREAGRRELSQLVQVTLDQLPGRYGHVLEWRYIQGLSVDEIAHRLGIGYKAAESLLSRARESFRDAFSMVAGTWPVQPARGPSRAGGL